jgi:hypothetical protein
MSRSPSVPVLAKASAVAALAALVAGCAPVTRDHPPPAPVDVISIQVSGCATEYIAIVVHPWTARVRRAAPLRWTTPAEVDSVAIQAVHDGWPFPWPAAPQPTHPPQLRPPPPPRPRRSAPGGTPIQAGPITPGVPMGVHSYRILLYCEGRVIDIDPEIIIFEPD